MKEKVDQTKRIDRTNGKTIVEGNGSSTFIKRLSKNIEVEPVINSDDGSTSNGK